MKTASNVQCDTFFLARQGFESLISKLSDGPSEFGDSEKLIEEEGREVLRLVLQGKIDMEPEPIDSRGVKGSDGLVRTHQRKGKRILRSVFGKVSVSRTLYSAKTKSIIGAIAPKDGALNLPERSYSHRVTELAVKSAAKGSFDSAADDLQRFIGMKIPKKSIENLAVEASKDFNEFYDQRTSTELQKMAEEKDFTVITTDAKGIVVREEDLRNVTKKKAREAKGKQNDKRLGKGQKKNRKRMAQVAAVYHVDKYTRTAEDIVSPSENRQKRPRPRIEGKRVWAGIEKDAHQIIANTFEELDNRDPEKKTSLVGLVDGNAHQIECLEASAVKQGRTITVIVDIIHVIEYLWKASRALYNESDPQCQEFVSHYLNMLLTIGPSQTAKGMRSKATKACLDEEARIPIDKACDYILKLKEYMNYSHYIAEGMPIGTGVIEGACRHLICDRLDLTGARWSLNGAEAVLRMRSTRILHLEISNCPERLAKESP